MQYKLTTIYNAKYCIYIFHVDNLIPVKSLISLWAIKVYPDLLRIVNNSELKVSVA